MNLILLQSSEIDADRRCRLTGRRAQHIRKVLKAQVGQSLRIGLLNGPLGSGVVEQVEGHAVSLLCRFEDVPPPVPRIDLLLAMPRPKVMKRLWAQLAALGVGRIVLLRADKVERYYFDSHVLEPAFCNELLIEGLQQARCTRLPEVMVRPLFKPFVEDELDTLFAGSLKLLADPAGTRYLGEVLSSEASVDRILLAIGPEGGWVPYELQLLGSHGFQMIGMGSRILRTDTAAIALIATIYSLLRG